MSLLAFKLRYFCLVPGSKQSKQILSSFTLSINPNINKLLSTRWEKSLIDISLLQYRTYRLPVMYKVVLFFMVVFFIWIISQDSGGPKITSI
jgi:hypothetical protein